MVFGGRKAKKDQQEEKDRKATLRKVRRALGKDAGRKVFGFKCAPAIPVTLKKEADGLHVPLFALAEHCLQLGSIQLQEAMREPEEREELRRHIVEDHVQPRTVEKIARYDEEAADWLADERRRRFEIDRAARVVVAKFGLRDARQIEEVIDLGLRTMLAVMDGATPPPPLSRSGYRRRSRSTQYKAREDGLRETPGSEEGLQEDEES